MLSVLGTSAVAIGALLGLLISDRAAAWAVTVEPDAVAAGAPLASTFLPNVALSIVGRSADVIAIDGFSAFNGRNVATTGTNVFGQSPVGSPVATGQVWDEVNYGLLRADFASTVSYVAVDLIFDDDDSGFLRAFASDGSLLSEVIASGDGRSTFATARAFIYRPETDIAYVLAGGIAAEGIFLDNLVAVVPEPSTIAIVSGAFGGSLLLRRRNRGSDPAHASAQS